MLQGLTADSRPRRSPYPPVDVRLFRQVVDSLWADEDDTNEDDDDVDNDE